MVSLTVGMILSLLAWTGLMIAVVHGKHVSEQLSGRGYENGPHKRRGGSDTDPTSNEDSDHP